LEYALDIYFEAFMAFCFSEIHGDINWSKNYESLDTELQEVVRDADWLDIAIAFKTIRVVFLGKGR
jgi:hypothetical protein